MPGARYTPDRAGLAELGRSSEMGQACLDAARRGAAFANRDFPAGDYRATAATVISGRNNELRAGALIEEHGASGAARRVLARTISVVQE